MAFATQPGHIPERARVIARTDRALESMDKAAEMASKAEGIEAAADSAIYSDDPNAVEAVKAKLVTLEARRERMRRVNALYRKGDAAGLAALGLDMDAIRAKLAAAGPYWGQAPHLPYELSNMGGQISRLRARVGDLKARQGRAAQAEAAPGGVIVEGGEYVRVTFAQKPDRAIISALKSAGFEWGAGGWHGYRERLPPAVLAMAVVPVEPVPAPEAQESKDPAEGEEEGAQGEPMAEDAHMEAEYEDRTSGADE